jgi:hypothetical protein
VSLGINVLVHYISSTDWLLSHLTTLFTTDQVICLMAVLFVSDGFKELERNQSRHIFRYYPRIYPYSRPSRPQRSWPKLPTNICSGYRSRYSDWLRAGWLRGWSSSPGGGKNFHFSMSSKQTLGLTQPPIQSLPGALSSGVKRPGREADHSPPTSAEVMKTWVYTSTPSYVFMA